MPDDPLQPGFWRRLRNWSAGPVALAIFTAALVSHTFAISDYRSLHARTGSAKFFHATFLSHHGACRSGHVFNLVRTNGLLETVSMHHIDPALHMDEAAGWIGVVMLRCPHRERQGFWATTAVQWQHDVRDRTVTWGLMTPQEQAETRAIVVQAMEEYVECREPACACGAAHGLALLRAGDGVTRVRVWSGYVHNAVALTLALLFIRAGFVTVRTTPRRIAAWRRSRRGRCRTCGYDLTGLTRGVCPECGAQTPTPAH